MTMKNIRIRRGLDIPLSGAPVQEIRPGAQVDQVALIGDDYIGLKPSMLVRENDPVQLGQPLFTDKKNPGVIFTSPGCGVVSAIHRGDKRRFESLVIRLDGAEERTFFEATAPVGEQTPEQIRRLFLESGLWPAFRTRPLGKIPRADGRPASLFVTALDTRPLAADPLVAILDRPELFRTGLRVLRRLLAVPIHLCSRPGNDLPGADLEGIESWGFSGPHPAGLPSTHIHCIDPVGPGREVWHLCAQDVLAIGHLFTHGRLSTERIIALAGPGIRQPSLLSTRQGASLLRLCRNELKDQGSFRLLSGSVLDGRQAGGSMAFLGRYHTQVAAIEEGDGRSLFGWMAPGADRFSITRLFASALFRSRPLPLLTALWGGRRAIYPLDVYERVLPLDMIAIRLLKCLAIGDAEQSAELGCLELIEEDLALCSFVCPGKNEFGPMLRRVLTAIEQGG